MSCKATEHTQFIIEAVLVLGSDELAIFAQLWGDIQLGEPELVEVLAVFPEDSLESLEVPELVLPEEAEAEGLLEDDLEELEGFACLLSSDLYSQ